MAMQAQVELGERLLVAFGPASLARTHHSSLPGETSLPRSRSRRLIALRLIRFQSGRVCRVGRVGRIGSNVLWKNRSLLVQTGLGSRGCWHAELTTAFSSGHHSLLFCVGSPAPLFSRSNPPHNPILSVNDLTRIASEASASTSGLLWHMSTVDAREA
ncbi:hypothetical protein MPTK1_1g13440 [Marchantia polymorpha subsp. ruderalis]|uniref:Uncharacterized protein n=2 Tax=Marchantia polymorpha TaxID=3197 RepID=A0AAF6APQ7_MARPO|nr:hypothetical protein MARPO_0019s0114 [Marchantia polymorpha]BBM98427.1 hypothetical protein Mp_1g13440 [Marchantia polymorpha subsp. ruderalis]|eukprot:PTQ44697.1 hypothetical protein MARPO_0019s0114 [Marchantia polymorpha]